MTSEHVDLNRFIVDGLEQAHRSVEGLAEGVTDEQFYHQPTHETNSIAWLVFHLSRWRDKASADATGETQVWISEGWAQRFGMAEERTGVGDTPEQVAAFKVPRDQVLGYADAAHRASVERVSKLAPEQFDEQVDYWEGTKAPSWRAWAGVIVDSMQHVGQIDYLRGLIGGSGWR